MLVFYAVYMRKFTIFFFNLKKRYLYKKKKEKKCCNYKQIKIVQTREYDCHGLGRR